MASLAGGTEVAISSTDEPQELGVNKVRQTTQSQVSQVGTFL